MAGNFGIGLGSFMSGALGGASFALNYKNAMGREERAAEDHAFQMDQRGRQQSEQARSDRNMYDLRDATADTFKAADSSRAQDLLNGQDAAPLADYFYQKAGGITDQLLKSGEVEKAEQFQKFLTDENSKRGTIAWGKAAQSLMGGDLDNGFKQINSALSNPGYGNGLTEIKKWEQQEGKNGKPGNIKLTFMDKGADKERVEEMDLPDLQHFILTQASPVAAFSMLQSNQKSADSLKVDVAKATAKSRLDQAAALGKEGRANTEFERREGIKGQEWDRRDALKEEALGVRDERRAETTAQRDARLAATGEQRDVTRSQLRQVEKKEAAAAKPAVDKTQAQVATAYRDLLANDPAFGRMSESEKEARVAQYLGSQDRVVDDRRGSKAAAPPVFGVRPRTAFGQ